VRAAIIILGVLLLVGCSSMPTLPYRARLYTGVDPRFDFGQVIAEREDGFLYFRFDDRDRGDHGYMWIDPHDGYHRIVRSATDPLIPITAAEFQR